MKVKFLGSPVLGDIYNGPGGLQMKKGDVCEVPEAEGQRLIMTFTCFEIVKGGRSVDAPAHDRMVREPQNKRGRKNK